MSRNVFFATFVYVNLLGVTLGYAQETQLPYAQYVTQIGDEETATLAGPWLLGASDLPRELKDELQGALRKFSPAADIQKTSSSLQTVVANFQEEKLTASDGASNDLFGISVASSGDRVIVGSVGDDDNGSSSGSAYVFEFDRSSWTEAAKLTASDGASFDGFGNSVAISGDRVAIGSRGSGSVDVFEFDGSSWTEAAKLTASDGASSDGFGVSVAISGDWVVVGSHNDDDRGPSSGSAYLFEFDGSSWKEAAKLTASDGASFDGFGGSVAISGDRMVIGSNSDDDKGASSGSAYVFEFDGSL